MDLGKWSLELVLGVAAAAWFGGVVPLAAALETRRQRRLGVEVSVRRLADASLGESAAEIGHSAPDQAG